MKFDLDKIKSIDHHCTGCHSKKKCCCACYDIFVSRTEMQRILHIYPLVAGYCPGLIQNGEFDNVFEEFDDGSIQLDTDENGLCVFAYRQAGIIRCALHTVAIDMDIPVETVKPFHCLLWPMAISPGPEPMVSLQENALDFPCNRPQKSDDICPSLQETLQMLFRETG
jgi:hypothetical protein